MMSAARLASMTTATMSIVVAWMSGTSRRWTPNNVSEPKPG